MSRQKNTRSAASAEHIMLKRVNTIALFVFFVFGLCFPSRSASFAQPVQHYQTEKEARQRCPNDTVVWVNVFTISKGSGGMARPNKVVTNAEKKRTKKVTGRLGTVNRVAPKSFLLNRAVALATLSLFTD